MLVFLFLLFKATPVLYFAKVPMAQPAFTEPFVPKDLFFLRRILMIPAFPAASYLADGLLMISMASTLDDCMDFKKSARSFPASGVGLPSI